MTSELESVAVVGGASGLGAATVEAFHAAGFAVAVLDRDGARAAELAGRLGPTVTAAAVEMTAASEVEAVFDACATAGRLRAVVCCAGIGWAERLLGRDGPHDPAAFARVVDVNLRGTFNVLVNGARVMAQNEADEAGERGVCILTSSIAAEDGQEGQIAYAASKAAVAGMALPAARDLASLGVRVCVIAPGVFDTPLLAGLPERARTELERQVPWPPRLGDPEEFGSLAVEIVRNRMLNGSVLRLDGALRMPYVRPHAK
jgi:NAD(P)-dependent dehydrogenase (short-subunit alcohol dehydrogenase family)